jgi:hypothetical protein
MLKPLLIIATTLSVLTVVAVAATTVLITGTHIDDNASPLTRTLLNHQVGKTLQAISFLHLFSCWISELTAVTYILVAIPLEQGATIAIIVVCFVFVIVSTIFFYCYVKRKLSNINEYV